jgi:hypothetical protein
MADGSFSVPVCKLMNIVPYCPVHFCALFLDKFVRNSREKTNLPYVNIRAEEEIHKSNPEVVFT